MPSLIQKAAVGQRSAMEQLYAAAKQKTYFVASGLLDDRADADRACIWAFRNIWYELDTEKIETETEFIDLAVRRVIRYCKKLVLRKNPKAYNMPFNRNFLLSGMLKRAPRNRDVVDEVLAQFTPLQRLIFVLDNAVQCDENRIAGITELDRKAVDAALTAQISNVERILTAMGNKTDSYETVLEYFAARETEVEIPETVEKQIMEEIDRIAVPVEQKELRKKVLLGVAAAMAVCAVIAGIVALGSRSDTQTTAATTGGETVSNTEAADNTEETAENTEQSPEVTDSSSAAVGDGATLEEAIATHYVEIEIADYGTIKLELYGNSAPATVENFVSLAESGFYDGLTFHRICEGFVIQGGDPNGDSTGGSDEEITGEFSANGFENNLSHVRGVISMARSSEYDSASSQFFIVHEDSTASLDGKYAAFGYVTEGIEVVDAICAAAEPTDSNGSIAPEAQPVITSVKISYAQ